MEIEENCVGFSEHYPWSGEILFTLYCSREEGEHARVLRTEETMIPFAWHSLYYFNKRVLFIVMLVEGIETDQSGHW